LNDFRKISTKDEDVLLKMRDASLVLVEEFRRRRGEKISNLYSIQFDASLVLVEEFRRRRGYADRRRGEKIVII
jgi:hypothetical protein